MEGAAVYLGYTMAVKGDKQDDLMRKMLQDYVDLDILPMLGGKRSAVVLDRECCSVNILYATEDAEFAFIMPVVKNSKIKAAIEEHASGKRTVVSLYTIKSAKSREFAIRLIINKNLRRMSSDNLADRRCAFATALKYKRCDELQE